MAEQTGPETVVVSWTPPSPPPSRGYRITVNSATTSFSRNVSSSPHNLTSLEPGVYSIQLVALTQHYPSEGVAVEFTVGGGKCTQVH